jgi:hypothetical protein
MVASASRHAALSLQTPSQSQAPLVSPNALLVKSANKPSRVKTNGRWPHQRTFCPLLSYSPHTLFNGLVSQAQCILSYIHRRPVSLAVYMTCVLILSSADGTSDLLCPALRTIGSTANNATLIQSFLVHLLYVHRSFIIKNVLVCHQPAER